MPETVLEALKAMRPPFALYEADLHRLIGERLTACGIAYEHEARLGCGSRIDYLVGDVGVEVKKGKPSAATLTAQLKRYAQNERIRARWSWSAGKAWHCQPAFAASLCIRSRCHNYGG